MKDKNFRHAVKLFSLQAENNQHDAQYNLAILLEAGKGAPQDFTKALIWAWSAQLGGIEAAEELAEDVTGYLPEKSIEEVREAVRARLRRASKREVLMPYRNLPLSTFKMLEEPDYETAYIWFSISTALGLERCALRRATMRATMSRMKGSSICRARLAQFMKALTLALTNGREITNGS